MLNRDFYSFREKFIVEDINGTSTTCIKWITTWKYVLKQKNIYLISMVVDIISSYECYGSIKKIKNSFSWPIFTNMFLQSLWNLEK